MTITSPDTINDLLRQAAEWRLIALLLERPSGDWTQQVDALKLEVLDHELRLAADAAPRPFPDGLYDTIFGPGGPAAPREVSYRPSLDGNFLAELAALYDAFAYHRPGSEPPDHVAAQVGFVSYLRFKQLYALSRGDDEQADIAANAAQRVIDEHLVSIALPLANSLQASGVDYLARATAALLKRVGPPRHQPLSIIPALDHQSGADCSPGCTFEDDLPAPA